MNLYKAPVCYGASRQDLKVPALLIESKEVSHNRMLRQVCRYSDEFDDLLRIQNKLAHRHNHHGTGHPNNSVFNYGQSTAFPDRLFAPIPREKI